MAKDEFAGRIALVTGAASGIGAAVAVALLKRGAKVVAFDNNTEGLQRLAQEWPGFISAHCVDVSRAEQVERAVASVESDASIEYLVQAAGVMIEGRLHSEQLHAEQVRHAFAINVEGNWLVSRAVARGMIERRRGAMVTIASNAASTPRIGMGMYAASKAAVSMLTRNLGLELAEYGIRCNVISPGSTDTTMLRKMAGDAQAAKLIGGDPQRFRLGIPLGRIAQPDDIAAASLFLLSAEARHITMHDLRIDGGATF